MSLTASLNAALSGLTATSRATEVVSSNLANATTEGYAPRQLNLSARGDGMVGVRIDGVTRQVDKALLVEVRLANAERGFTATQSGTLARLEAAFGLPGEDASLAGRIARLEADLTQAASRPDSAIRLESARLAASELAAGIRGISQEIQTIRTEADRGLADAVGRLNEALARIHDLNGQIARHGQNGGAPNTLLDQRQALIDSISDIVPLREVARPNGAVALITEGGAVLLDHKPAEIGFAPVLAVTADMTLANGALSGLTINDRPVSAGLGGQLGGGTLSALLAVRDEIGVAAQADIDALAHDLIERMEAADAASAAPLGMGLFTDQGAPLDPAQITGLAGRVTLNPLADPDQGGGAWRLRDGLGALLPGDPGATQTLNAMAAALAGPSPTGAAGHFALHASFSANAAEVHSTIGNQRHIAEGRHGFAAARAESLREMQLQQSVDTDAELQKLLLIERSYAANARVLRAVDEMLKTLVGI